MPRRGGELTRAKLHGPGAWLLALILLQASVASAECPDSGGNFSEGNTGTADSPAITLDVDSAPTAVWVEGMDAFPDCESTVWIEYFITADPGSSSRGVGIGFSTLACIIHEGPDSTAKGRDRRRNGSRTSPPASGAGV